MKINASLTLGHAFRLRVVTLSLALGSMLFIQACGGDASQPDSSAAAYPAGVSEDIEQQLKYDARVESFEPDGEDLVVNVNDSWASSPQGMQERAVGQWYSLWHAEHSGKLIVKHNGNPVASWSGEGYKPEKPETSEDEASSEG